MGPPLPLPSPTTAFRNGLRALLRAPPDPGRVAGQHSHLWSPQVSCREAMSRIVLGHTAGPTSLATISTETLSQ